MWRRSIPFVSKLLHSNGSIPLNPQTICNIYYWHGMGMIVRSKLPSLIWFENPHELLRNAPGLIWPLNYLSMFQRGRKIDGKKISKKKSFSARPPWIESNILYHLMRISTHAASSGLQRFSLMLKIRVRIPLDLKYCPLYPGATKLPECQAHP